MTPFPVRYPIPECEHAFMGRPRMCAKCGMRDLAETAEKIDHPAHYGGANDPYEAIKVIEAWKLGFNLGNAVKYISRAEKKGAPLDDLKKARWYLDREIANREGKPMP